MNSRQRRPIVLHRANLSSNPTSWEIALLSSKQSLVFEQGRMLRGKGAINYAGNDEGERLEVI